jgi:predicted DNA-binding transcriptional regulator AlpA
MPDSAEILALLDQGYVRPIDIARMLGVTRQRVIQVVRRDDFPKSAKVIGQRRLWRREDLERWRDARPRVWAEA